MVPATGIRARIPRWLLPLAGVLLFLACMAVFSSIGGPQDPLAGLAVIFDLLIRAGLPAAAYLLAGIGLGEIFSPLLKGSRQPTAVRAALGLGLLLSLSHGLGCVGLLSGRTGAVVAAGVCLVGLVLLARRLTIDRDRVAQIRLPVGAALAIPGVALMLVAACNPPGWLWDSEAGGYDALEYHLQLPQEWIRLGQIRPLDHNVYSFLPSYIESGFVHVAAMSGAPSGPTPASRAWGLLAGDGFRAISCQLLSSGIAVFAAIQIAWLVLAAGRRFMPDTDHNGAGRWTAGAAVAAALLMSTPWTIVVGSLAYNDLAVLGLLAAAMIVALDDGLRPAVRTALVGLLVGMACGCKPTALFMAGAPAGFLVLALMPRRQWPGAIAAGAVAGLLATAPWLLRNWLACGNPVFPFGASVFGAAHWTAEQFEHYRAAHSFHGTLLQRLALLVLIDPTDPGGSGYRGLSHPQWFIVLPACLVAGAIAPVRRDLRWVSGLFALALFLQIIAWLFLTHLQSRFLLPLAAPACALFGLGAARLAGGHRPDENLSGQRQRIRGLPLIAPLACLVQFGAAVVIFAEQRSGEPNALLLAGPAFRTGEALTPQQRSAALEHAGPELRINLTVPPGRLVYLLGDATPFYYTADVLYNSTFDRWPLGDAVRAAPNDPAGWTRALRERGVVLVLINFNELARLARSGWADPAVTPAVLQDWLKSGPRMVRNWPEQGWLLVELPQEAPR